MCRIIARAMIYMCVMCWPSSLHDIVLLANERCKGRNILLNKPRHHLCNDLFNVHNIIIHVHYIYFVIDNYNKKCSFAYVVLLLHVYVHKHVLSAFTCLYAVL